MRELPEQAVHRPFEAGPYRMAMDLVAVPEAEWFEFDRRYSSEMAEKRSLLATAHQDVFAAIPMSAAALCFPSRWRLQDKIGKPLSAVHAPVPLYADRLARPVDRFMRHIKSGHIASRLNWSLLDDPTLFQPNGKWRVDGGSHITAENAGSRVFLRVERQTLRRLSTTGAVLFGIRVHVYPIDRVIDRPDRAATLAKAVQALPPEIQHYKSLPPFRQQVLAWLAIESAKPPSRDA